MEQIIFILNHTQNSNLLSALAEIRWRACTPYIEVRPVEASTKSTPQKKSSPSGVIRIHSLMGLNVHSNLLRLIRDGGGLGWGWMGWGWVPMPYHVVATLSPPEWLCVKAGSRVSHFNVSFIVRAKSQDSVHKPQYLKRKESRNGLRVIDLFLVILSDAFWL